MLTEAILNLHHSKIFSWYIQYAGHTPYVYYYYINCSIHY